MRIPIFILSATVALGACSTFASPDAPVCDGHHRRPANLYGSVLVPASPAAPTPAPPEADAVPNAEATADDHTPVLPTLASAGCA